MWGICSCAASSAKCSCAASSAEFPKPPPASPGGEGVVRGLQLCRCFGDVADAAAGVAAASDVDAVVFEAVAGGDVVVVDPAAVPIFLGFVHSSLFPLFPF